MAAEPLPHPADAILPPGLTAKDDQERAERKREYAAALEQAAHDAQLIRTFCEGLNGLETDAYMLALGVWLTATFGGDDVEDEIVPGARPEKA